MRSVRLNFSKTGRAIYVSHLDLTRIMSRAIRRAGLSMWFTEGFNPHPYLTFALPLSLGQSSDCEYMDIRITDDMTNDEIITRLNGALPDGINILSAGDPVFDAKEIEKAMYFVKIVFKNNQQAEKFYSTADELVKGEELLAEKIGKKGHRKVKKTVNLIDYIYDIKLTCSDNTVNMQCILAAGNTNNLNPSLLVETIEKHTGEEDTQIHIVRKKLITKNNKNFK